MAYSRGVSLTQIHPAPGADADTDIDIIAIHGLDTKSPDTWTSKSNYPNEDVNWLACPHMLPERIGPARIFTCDWPADLFEQSDSIQKTAEEFARLLLAGIKRRPLPAKTGYAKKKDRPIVFIASCLGGIILIKALVIASHSNEYAVVRQSTRGIIFLATPFRGTSFQDVADWAEPGLRAWASIRGQKVSNLINDVKGSTFSLEELVRKFTQLCHDEDYPYQVVTFYETGLTSFHRKFPVSWLIPSGVLDHLVPPKPLVGSSSATLDIVTDPLPLNRRHVMMNKFNSPEDPDYQCVVGKIEEILQNIRTNSPLDDADAWIRNRHYTKDRLKIERLSGDRLPMDQCYINLAVVEQRSQNSEHPSTEDAKSSPFSIFNRQKIETPDSAVQIELASIFSQRQCNGKTIQPRRILIRGRAGIGKTTLCKKIVHEFTQGTWSEWNDLFDRILWIPLRNLKLEERRHHPAYDFVALFTHEYFSLPNNKPDLAKQLARSLETSSSNTLFLLDGLDEVSQELAGSSSMSRFLDELLEQPNIIVTSRPPGRLPLNLDLELEAIGFYPNQVKEYVKKTFTSPKANEVDGDKILSFLEEHWLIQGLVRIPIQLDALCYSWKDIRADIPETMTALYQAIELSLWKKDIVRLEKTHNYMPVTLHHMQNASQHKIEELIKAEISFLESLAFAGLYSDIIEFEPKHLNFISDRFSGFLVDKTTSFLSFLRTSNPSSEYRNRNYHFIHLTFQEYFAARHFVRQWTAREPLSCVELGREKINKIEPVNFFQKHKYTSRYDILWRFVAGLLDTDSAEISLFFQRIEEEPLDLLGPAHQRLVMHCLSEVSSDLPIRASLEQRLSNWLLFEWEISKYDQSCLASEVEFPEQALDTAFREASDTVRKEILSLIPKRTTAPASVIQQAVSWLGNVHVDGTTRKAAVKTLQRLPLSNETLGVLAARLEDKNMTVREAVLGVLGKQSILPKEILKAIAARVNDEDPVIQIDAIEILGQQSVLPDEILKAMAAKFEDEDPSVQATVIAALDKRMALPDEILKAVAARFEDKDLKVQDITVITLKDRLTLPDEILQAMAARLKDRDASVRIDTAWALDRQPTLSDDILRAIAALLKDKDPSVQKVAFEVLNRHVSLSREALKTIVTQFGDNESNFVQVAVIKALSNRTDLPSELLQAIVTQLKNNENLLVHVTSIGALGTLQVIAASLEDNENSAIQVAVMKALSRQSGIPDEILKVIVAYLKDYKDDLLLQGVAIGSLDTRSGLSTKNLYFFVKRAGDESQEILEDVVEALGEHSSLPDNIINAIAALLRTGNIFIKSVAIAALSNQSGLSKKILSSVAAQLKVNYKPIQEAAIQALGDRSGLSNKILNTVAAQLEVNDWGMQAAAIQVLDHQSALSNKILYAVAKQLDKEEYLAHLAEKTLRKHRHFYSTLFDGPYAPSLYKVLLRRSFRSELSWCIDDDGSSFISLPGDGGRIVIDKRYDMRAIIRGIRPTNYPAQ